MQNATSLPARLLPSVGLEAEIEFQARLCEEKETRSAPLLPEASIPAELVDGEMLLLLSERLVPLARNGWTSLSATCSPLRRGPFRCWCLWKGERGTELSLREDGEVVWVDDPWGFWTHQGMNWLLPLLAPIFLGSFFLFPLLFLDLGLSPWLAYPAGGIAWVLQGLLLFWGSEQLEVASFARPRQTPWSEDSRHISSTELAGLLSSEVERALERIEEKRVRKEAERARALRAHEVPSPLRALERLRSFEEAGSFAS